MWQALPPHVHAQFQRVGGRHPPQRAAEQRHLRRAAVRDGVPTAVGADGLDQLGRAGVQGLTFVRFSAQLEPCLTQENTLPYTPQTPPNTPLMRAT